MTNLFRRDEHFIVIVTIALPCRRGPRSGHGDAPVAGVELLAAINSGRRGGGAGGGFPPPWLVGIS